MRALIARLHRWLADRAERQRRFRAAQSWRDGFAVDDQHEQVRDRILTIAAIGVVILACIGADIIGIIARVG